MEQVISDERLIKAQEEPGLDEDIEVIANRHRDKMSALEEKINELTNNEFFSGFTCRGIETYELKELHDLVDKYPKAKDTVRECLKAHIEFYDWYLGKRWREDPKEKIMLLSRAFPPAFSLKNWKAKPK